VNLKLFYTNTLTPCKL